LQTKSSQGINSITATEFVAKQLAAMGVKSQCIQLQNVNRQYSALGKRGLSIGFVRYVAKSEISAAKLGAPRLLKKSFKANRQNISRIEMALYP